jgi:hypothetical protein
MSALMSLHTKHRSTMNTEIEPELLKTSRRDICPTLAKIGNLGIADPCYVVPDAKWSDFISVCIQHEKANDGDRAVFVFEGVPFRTIRTHGDGVYGPGVAVDSGTLAEFPFDLAKEVFQFETFQA